MDKRVKRKLCAAAGGVLILTLAFWFLERGGESLEKVMRNGYGQGSKKETYGVTVGGELKEEPVELEIGEREYTSSEVRGIFKQTMDELESLILGENRSVDRIEHDMNLITKMPDTPIAITWESDRSEILNSLGEIQEENLTEEGEMVELKGTLSYGEEQCLYLVNVMVYPKAPGSRERMLDEIGKAFTAAEQENKESAYIDLPKEIDGKTIKWTKQAEHRAPYLLALGMAAVFLLWFQEKQKKEKEKEQRRIQMRADYPEIISQLSLLAGAGLTVKNAWKKIVVSYQQQGNEKKERAAYEEMAYTLREMQGGVTEQESYERFGRRCQLPEYMKLGTLLSQNVRKGTKGLTKMLAQENKEAMEKRKHQAKKQGETAGTKLLLPMCLMLLVVLVIVIVPAFLSISL